MGKRKTIVASVTFFLLLIGGLCWWWFSGNDAQIEKVRQMHAEAFTGKGPPSREKMEAIRLEMDKLSPRQREEVMRPMWEEMERRMDERMDKYFAMTEAQKKAFLDEEIKRMEDFGKAMAKGPPPGAGGPGGRPPGGKAGGPPGGPHGPRDMGSDASKLRRNEMRAHWSPTKRSKMNAFMSDMVKRRIELGLPPRPSPPRGGPPK